MDGRMKAVMPGKIDATLPPASPPSGSPWDAANSRARLHLRHPVTPDGRGRMPLWLGAEIKAGKDREHFLIA
jgi:hypothetical protein